MASQHQTWMFGTGKRPTLAPATLHPTGVYRANTSRCCWCALTAPLHPYRSKERRYFSVALSSRSLALGVTQQVWSLECPDFPQRGLHPSATASPTLLVNRLNDRLPILSVQKPAGKKTRAQNLRPLLKLQGMIILKSTLFLRIPR